MEKSKSKVLRVLGWMVCILVAIPVLFYITLVLFNLKDDPLSPEVEKLLNTRPAEIDAQSNGYFAWIGVAGPENQDPHIWGQRWYIEVLGNDKEARTSFPPPEFVIGKERRTEEQKACEIPCDKVEACLGIVASNLETARSSLQKGKVTLERGDMAIAYPAYQEPWRPDYSAASQLPSFLPAWGKLKATRFALAVAEGRHEEALDRFSREMSFQIRQMRGASSLIDKLVSVGYLRHHYLLLSQYIQRHPVEAKKYSERIVSMLVMLPDEAVSLQPCMQSEKRVFAVMLISIKRQKVDLSRFLEKDGDDTLTPVLQTRLLDYLGRPLLLINNTVNGVASQYDVWMRIDSFKGDAYRQALADARQSLFKQPEWTFTMRNPIGQIIKNVSPPDFSQYFMRRDDLLALRGLVEFQFKLLQQGESEADAIAETIKVNQESLRHPYSGATPVWDKEKRRLSYPLIEGGDNKSLPTIQI